ncbi:MAG: PD-(D/E)XK nuclease family protein [Myxococcales bacterium]|nr:PD-(D/E)XK nuclease family protein [Myxococcales bacterium]
MNADVASIRRPANDLVIMDAPNMLPILLLTIGGVIIAWVSIRWAHWWMKHRDTKRRVAVAKRAQRAENYAEQLAEHLGYTIVGRQVGKSYALSVGQETFLVELRIDLLLEKDGQFYLAEVKSGTKAPDIQHAPTRRQLLEYAYAFDVSEILLFDMSSEVVRHIRFPVDPPDPAENTPKSPPAPPPEAPIGLLFAGLVLGLGAATIEPVDAWLHQLSALLAQTLSP